MKRAFTLIELLVYMAIMGFIIIVAGRVFSDSTKMRVRSQNMIKNSEEIGKISNLIKEDISQMGVKAWGQNEGNEYKVYDIGTNYQEIYWSVSSTPRDSSSYALKHNKRADGTFYDSIVFRKAAFDEQGRFLGIREIAWVARTDSSLVRRCATIHKCTSPTVCGTTDSDLSVCKVASSVADVEPVLISKNIVNFKIIPSKPGVKDNTQDTLFGTNNEKFQLVPGNVGGDVKDLTSSINGDVVTVSGLAQNYGGSGKAHNRLYLLTETAGNDFSNCKKLSFIKGETYAIEFEMPFPSLSDARNAEDSLVIQNSPQFIPGRDHLAIGLRKSNGVQIPNAPDILFYPPQSEALTRHHLEFSVKDTVNNACVVIIAAFYPPSPIDINTNNGTLGILQFSNFKIFRKSDEAFHFPTDDNYGITNIKEKTNVKAFQLLLEMDNRGEKSGTYSDNGKGMVITTPNNGIVPRN